MSSFDEYYNQWKKDNNVKEEKAYLPTSAKEISASANNYIDNVIMPKINKKTTVTPKLENKKYEQKKDRNILDSIGKTIENGWLGGISGIKQSFNYIYKTGRNHLESEERQKIENVMKSPNLNKEEKDLFFNALKNKGQDNEEKNIIIPISQRNNINPLKDENINVEKIKKESETSGFDKSIEEDSQKIAENINSQSNNITKKLAEIMPSVGNMVVGGVVSAINPGAGAGYFTLSSAGSYYNDAKQRGMTNKQAETYAGIMGLMEGETESITLGNLGKAGKTVKALITGTGKEVAKEGIEQIGKASIKTALKEYGIGIADNVMQEALIEPIQETVAGTVGGKDKANWDNMGQRMLQAGIDGGLVAAITGGAEIGIQSCVGIVEKSKKGENITKDELKNAVKDASNKLDVEKMIVDSTQQQINKYRDYNTNQPSDSVSQEWLNRANSIINENNTNLQQNATQNQINPPMQQITQLQNKTAQNGNIEQRLQELKNIDTSEMNFLEKSKVKSEIRALEEGYISVDEWRKANEIKKQEAIKEYNEQKIQKELKKEDFSSFNLADNHKQQQLDIINKNNPADDDIHTWIRSTNDIKNFEEAFFEDGQYSGLDPDFTEKMANKAKETGKITVYSSYPIEQGIFVSPSVMEASQYAGGDVNKLYSKEVNINDVAWIDGAEGQYAKVNNIIANNGKTLYNDIALGETKNVPIEELLSLQTEGGYREQEQITNLREDISKNGIQNPIELVRNNDGSISIENGNHRLQIAKELGINEVPVKFVESWDNIGIDNTDSNSVKKWEEGYNGNNQNRAGINESNERTEFFKRSMDDNRNQLENGATATANDRLYDEVQAYNDRASSNSTFKKNNQELEKSSSINLLKNETSQEDKSPTRHEIIQNNREIARENIENISTWKDKKSGIRYQLETMERNMYDIIPDKAEAKKINDTYFEPIHTSEAEKQKFINNYNDRIRQFNLNKYESEAVQFLGEKKYNPDFTKGSREELSARNEIASKINKNIENGKINQEKVNNAIEEFRKIYDELFELENKTLKENGYKEKPYRKGYFPHFIDYIPETKTEKVLNKLGFKIDKRPLPTDIAGITEQFVPGKTWNKSTLERKSNKTDYNALKGFDTYISQASDNIFHTDNIQKLRGLENEIRYQYSEKGVQERIDNILNDETLYEDEKQVLLDKVLEQTNNPMPNLVTELRRYTNALANKKSEADRSIEQSAGRSIYSTVNAIENRFGANAVGLNIGSAITNFIPITQAYSQVSTKNMGRAIIDTVKSYANNDGFVDKSAFLTSRLNQSEKLYKTSLEKISDKTSFLFNAIDEVTSNIVVRGKYLENIQNGMSESEAIKNADQFARNVIADRSKGALPTKFEEKNPVTKMFTQFQLEVNNQYRYMFKDLPRDLAEKGLAGIALAFFKMFVGAWVYNEASEKITGRKPAFSPIDLVSSSYKTITDKDMKTYDKVANIGTDVAEQLPFVGGLVGGGRVPVNGAIPNAANLTKAGIGLATGEMDSNKAINTIGKELSKPLYYLLPPFGGGQIKKSVEGIQTVNQGGSYSVDSKGEETLRFPVENPNVGDYIKAGVFGKYALPKAKEYVDGGFKSLNAKDTKLYKNSKIDYDILKKYITDRDEKVNNKAKNKETKTKIIKNLPISTDQKWEIYKSDIFSETEKKDGITEKEEYEKLLKQGFSKGALIQWYDVNKIEGKKDVDGKTIEGSSQGQKALAIMKMNVPDEQKNKMLSLITTSKNPETVETLSRLEKTEKAYTDYFALNKKDTFFQSNISRDDVQDIQDLGINQDEFMKFAQNIGNIKSEKDKNGKTISGSKKKAVANYINSLNLSSGEKAILFAKAGYPDKNYKQAIYNYINGLNLSATRKKEIWDSLGYK